MNQKLDTPGFCLILAISLTVVGIANMAPPTDTFGLVIGCVNLILAGFWYGKALARLVDT